jgi:hypothetical protein
MIAIIMKEPLMMNHLKKLSITLSAFLIAATVAVAKSPISSGLVLWFRNGPNTAKIQDLSHHKNAGIATSLMVSNSPSLVSMQDTRQLTLALWIKPNSIPSEFPVLISKGSYQTPGADGGYELTLNANGDNDIIFNSGNFYSDTYQANGSLVNNHLGEWIHVAVVADANAQTIQFYVNGKSYTNVFTLGSLADANFNLTNNLYIGAPDPVADANRADFDGAMQHIMIFNRALSASEIQKIISTTKPKGVTSPENWGGPGRKKQTSPRGFLHGVNLRISGLKRRRAPIQNQRDGATVCNNENFTSSQTPPIVKTSLLH